ncbi:MAG TPA: hypothetical protein VFA45_21635 [Actinomycetes bacterium]|nr:hypothetical protein [Actinomycetes bacterium]
MTGRRRRGRPDQDLALALARVEAAFGAVQVLEVRPNPRRSGLSSPDGKSPAREQATQAALDLDQDQEQEQKGGEAVA